MMLFEDRSTLASIVPLSATISQEAASTNPTQPPTKQDERPAEDIPYIRVRLRDLVRRHTMVLVFDDTFS